MGVEEDSVGMAAQIPIVATTSTPGIARNSKKRPASPSHNGSSAGGYSASKKKKVAGASFTQVCCGSPSLRVRGAVRGGAKARAQGGAERGRRRPGADGPAEVRDLAVLPPVDADLICGANETFFSLVWTSGIWFKHQLHCVVLGSRRVGLLIPI